jgi:2-polyprenyl-3-methyl-5-hydroxy-6-metoxy-1,4-benzoquinol methylase
MNEYSRTKTDRLSSSDAAEFVWDTMDCTQVHAYVGPVLESWLQQAKPGRVLDLGCGNGALTARLAKFATQMVGTDHSDTGVQIARQHFPSIQFFRSDVGEVLPVSHHGAYDMVLATEVIEHLFKPRAVFERAREALRPGGALIITTPFHGYWKNLALAVSGKFDEHWHPMRDYGHIKFFSRRTLGLLLEEQGFLAARWARVGRVPLFARSMIVMASLQK